MGCGSVDSMTSGDRSGERFAIESVVADLVSAWRSSNGIAWGDCFTEDADFTTWFGLRMAGRDEIANGHQGIFDSFYAGTVYDLEVEFIRFLNEETALVGLSGSVTKPGDETPSAPQTVPLAVIVKSREGWKVAAFQNTYAGELETRRHGGGVRGGT